MAGVKKGNNKKLYFLFKTGSVSFSLKITKFSLDYFLLKLEFFLGRKKYCLKNKERRKSNETWDEVTRRAQI